ncbi:MAG: lysophospholipid acyltransferase family protein [Bacteroidales bacterium]|nr:lysophospholipid acyltransferase family protein [Bacteroidales bacterium]
MLSAFYFILFLTALLIVGITPWRLLYGFSDAVALLLRRVVRYRLDVVRDNLRGAFPDLKEEDRSALEVEVYRNLSDIAVETLKGFTMSRRAVRTRHRIVNPELLNGYLERGQSVIGLTAHINNWEWGAMSAALQLMHTPIAIYSPLSNRAIDRVIRWHRSLRGTVLAPTSSTYSTFDLHKGHPCIYLLLADQSPAPRNMERAIWVDFMGRDTPCIHGPEKYARLYGYPVVYIDIQRVRRGGYEIRLSPLCEHPTELPEGELTRLYMNRVAQAITQSPSSWLWTHRRWKRQHHHNCGEG